MPEHGEGTRNGPGGDKPVLLNTPKGVVMRDTPKAGPKGRPRTGIAVPSNPQAAARLGEMRAKNPGGRPPKS